MRSVVSKRSVELDDGGRTPFRRRCCFKTVDDDVSYGIADVLTLLAALRYSDPFTVLIISGHSGCRGKTFKDRGHCASLKSAMHLIDFHI